TTARSFSNGVIFSVGFRNQRSNRSWAKRSDPGIAMATKGKSKPRERDNLPLKTRVIVLTEAGYRCAVPTCRSILALDMHHIWEVSAGGGDDPSNLIALCPTCHALYHRGNI